MLLMKVSCTTWEKEHHDERELSVCNELGITTAVMAKGNLNDNGRFEIVDGFKVYRYTTRPLGNSKCLRLINKIITFIGWANCLRKYSPDIISGHDWPGVFIGYISNKMRKRCNRVPLVYDSHEFEIGRSGDRNKIAKWFIVYMERFLISRCVFSIMVNNSIANEVQRIHHLQTRPIVVRNIPSQWIIDKEKIRQTRHELLNSIGVSDDTFAIMYHGGIMNNRGVESVIELVSMNPNIVGIILGNGEEKYINSLHTLATEKGVKDRVVFHPAVSLDELWMYVGAADVGMVILRNVCTNHFYALPNKFFENIQSLTPIIGSDFPEIKRIVNEYNIGLVCDPDDLEAMNACVEKMRIDKEFYNKCKVNLEKAKEDLCWENEKKVLLEAYGNLLKEIKK